MTAKTLTLDATQREKLSEVYRFLLQLSERRKRMTADGETLEGDPTAASTDPLEDGADE